MSMSTITINFWISSCSYHNNIFRSFLDDIIIMSNTIRRRYHQTATFILGVRIVAAASNLGVTELDEA